MSSPGRPVCQTSRDGENWTTPAYVPSNVISDYGGQLVFYYLGIFAVVTTSTGAIIVYRTVAPTYWEYTNTVDESKYRAVGQIAAAAMKDDATGLRRFFITYRGTDDRVHLIYSDGFRFQFSEVNLTNFETTVSPALLGIGDNLYLVAVGEDKYIYYTILSADGKVKTDWTKIDGTGTQSAPAMTEVDGTAYLFHTAYDNGAFFYQSFDTQSGDWSSLTRQDAPTISSSLSAASSGRARIIVTYRGDQNNVQSQSLVNGQWSGEKRIGTYLTRAQPNLFYTPYPGMWLLTFAQATSGALVHGYEAPGKMCEKASLFVEGGDEWDCKWHEPESNKRVFSNFFSCC